MVALYIKCQNQVVHILMCYTYYIHKWLLVIMQCYSHVLYYIHKWLLVIIIIMQC